MNRALRRENVREGRESRKGDGLRIYNRNRRGKLVVDVCIVV